MPAVQLEGLGQLVQSQLALALVKHFLVLQEKECDNGRHHHGGLDAAAVPAGAINSHARPWSSQHNATTAKGLGAAQQAGSYQR